MWARIANPRNRYLDITARSGNLELFVELGKLVNVHGAVIGRYERDEVKPSIEMATQLAEALEVSLDYLVGSTDVLLEKDIVNKILDIQKLKENDKQHVFALLDAFIKQTKFKSIM